MALDRKYRHDGLQILAFPCNQFGRQEPGTADEIQAFAASYGVTFPLFNKHQVNGPHAREVFRYCTSHASGSFGAFIKWNFTKFLINRQGRVVSRYGPHESPLSFEHQIQELLAANDE